MRDNKSQPQQKIVVIGKDAVLGTVKTRLSPPLSAENATNIYCCLAQEVCAIALQTGLPVEISFRGDPHSPFARELSRMGCHLFPQPVGSLGDIIHHALHRADRVLALGMDTPLISSEELLVAINQQNTVFGPAEDGGYWMIASNRPPKSIFEQIDWSTELVLSQSLARCTEADIVYSLTQKHYDIDTVEDLRKLLRDRHISASLLQRIQVYA